MHTLSFTAYGQHHGQEVPRWRKLAPLAAIVAAHALMFYLFNNGMLRQVAHAVMPNIVTINFVAASEPVKAAPPPPMPSAPPPKLAVIVPPLPALAIASSEPTISVSSAPVRSSEAAASSNAASASVAAPAVAVAASASPKTISSVEYLRAPQAVYPNSSRRLGESGIVMLRVLIGEKGQAEQVVIQKSSGYSTLDEAGRQAVLRALYKPYIEDGKAIAVYALVPINFQLG